MIKIKLIKEKNGAKLIKEFQEMYGSIEALERAFKRDPENVKLYMDLTDWEYFQNHPKEQIKETEIIYAEKSNIDMLELELMGLIKNEHPKSISELAKIANKDISSVQKKIKNLNENGLIKIKEGNKNSKIPIVNYDKIEIAI
ncbi:hypothetical protein MBBAR_2c00160 [Methanobrevibacter arboriphilus JCM 13429 = DSM 1125]|uniref:Uncharacterized protein n=1 Tax=Methanobrevibacter arboriphilus JCM 13429 = DSM 1125 TaxID=1300164 RepID=A0A1V6N4D8_METAZ|nr:hypothetical protein [Methanobrevibacter arboriphilus]OQD59568.1 hypothetical protein MBBAR_2c00160 [Methanobrevibacter arboriphilus JCM 13429 = DSM 1125]